MKNGIFCSMNRSFFGWVQGTLDKTVIILYKHCAIVNITFNHPLWSVCRLVVSSKIIYRKVAHIIFYYYTFSLQNWTKNMKHNQNEYDKVAKFSLFTMTDLVKKKESHQQFSLLYQTTHFNLSFLFRIRQDRSILHLHSL